MKLAHAGKTFRTLRMENIAVKFGFSALLLTNAVMGWMLITRDETVILVPPFQNEDISFINGQANHDYYQQWAWSVAMLFGNISPGNVDFIRREVARIATPALYRDLEETFDGELNILVRDRATVTFSPEEIVYDPELDLFFVTGTQTLRGAGQRQPVNSKVTYELGFITQHLRVRLNRFDVYSGNPRTGTARDDS